MSTPTPQELLKTYLTQPQATAETAQAVFAAVAQGTYSPVQLSALLGTLNGRGITPADITAAATAFLAAATAYPEPNQDVCDCVGTGGDGANTINISTTASLLAAACGYPVIKHGNRAVSSKSGAADILQALGFNLEQTPVQAATQVAKTGFTFLFAPAYHPAFKHVGPVRAELGIPTIFNLLGPLLNPAKPNLQILGVARKELGEHMITSLKALGRKRALVVHGDGLDEISVCGPTDIWELHEDGQITHSIITPADLGLDTYTLAEIQGGDGAANAEIARNILHGTGTPAQTAAVAATAGAIQYLAGGADSLPAGVSAMLTALKAGTAATWLETATTAGEER